MGRKGTKLYSGLPANQFRLPDGWLGAFQEVQGLLQMTRGQAFGLAGVPLGGLDPSSAVTLEDLYGSAPRGADSISEFVPGALAGLAPSALANLFLATTGVFDGDLEDFFDNTSLTGLIGEIDLASGSQVHNQSFLASAGLNPFSANTGNLTSILGLPANAFRPSPQFLNGPDLFSNAASSAYHALQLQVNRRFSKGLQFQANYTFSKNIDLPFSSFATGNSFNNFFEVQVERALSGNDLTHDFKANAIWELPFGHGKRWGSGINPWANQLLGGWQLSSIASVAGDFPFNVSFGSMSSSFQGGSRPNFQGGVVVDNNLVHTGQTGRDDQGRVVYWTQQDFNGIFERPLLGNQGNTPRNWLRGPGYWNVDIAVMKHFPIREEMQVQFRAEFFNLFNNVNFGNPNGNLESSNFGRITGQNGDARIARAVTSFDYSDWPARTRPKASTSVLIPRA